MAANPDVAAAMESVDDAPAARPGTAAVKKKPAGPTLRNPPPAAKTAVAASKTTTEAPARTSTAAKQPKASPAKVTTGPRVGAGTKSMPKPF